MTPPPTRVCCRPHFPGSSSALRSASGSDCHATSSLRQPAPCTALCPLSIRTRGHGGEGRFSLVSPCAQEHPKHLQLVDAQPGPLMWNKISGAPHHQPGKHKTKQRSKSMASFSALSSRVGGVGRETGEEAAQEIPVSVWGWLSHEPSSRPEWTHAAWGQGGASGGLGWGDHICFHGAARGCGRSPRSPP